MKIVFEKYHGTGNDFIMIDNRVRIFDDTNSELIKRLCDRHFGIGADGLITIEKSSDSDFKMNYFNADGLPGSMCGNGGRCTVAFAKKLRMLSNDKVVFNAFDGKHSASILRHGIMGDAMISLKMNDVDEIEKNGDAFILNTGSPHYVAFINDVGNFDVVSEGKKIRFNERFNKEGINVNFVEIKNDELFIRTYERGVEDETLSCGTGVTASAIATAAIQNKISETNFNIKTLGGDLNVKLTTKDGKKFTDVFLEGAATFVFTGMIEA